MAKVYRPYFPEQDFLLPPSLREWLPEGHLAYFVSDLIDQLDLSQIEKHYEREERGYPPYHPHMMTKVLVYGYCVGVFSSRRLEKRLSEDIAFRVLAAGNEPDFRTISEFRRIHLKALEGLFVQVLQLALKLGTMKLGRVAIDGTKIRANASKHKAMSYERMLREEQRLREEVKQLLAEAEQTDKDEDKRYGRTKRGDELPSELARREERLKRIAEAKKDLEERARAEAEQKQNQKDGDNKRGSSSGGKRRSHVQPKPKVQHNFTDPESRIMKGADGFVQAYNAQAAVEPVLQLIVGQALTQQANGKQQLLPMIDAIKHQAKQRIREVLADSGYCSEENLRKAAKKKVDLYVATGKQKHNQPVPQSPRGRIPKSATLVERMKRKLMTRAGRAIYARRKIIVEPVFDKSNRHRASAGSCCAAWKKSAPSGLRSVQRTTCSSYIGHVRHEMSRATPKSTPKRTLPPESAATQSAKLPRMTTPVIMVTVRVPYSDGLLELSSVPSRELQRYTASASHLDLSDAFP